MDKGFAFPFQIAKHDGSVEMSLEKENIKQSVIVILSTEQGERVVRPDFGVRLHQYIFERMDSRTESMITREVIRALTMWEERITNIQVFCKKDEGCEGKLRINVSYQVHGRESDNAEILVE